MSRLILRLNAKRWALCERIRVLEGDLKHLREKPLEDFCLVEIKFKRGRDTDYDDLVMRKPCAERFVRELLAVLVENAADERHLSDLVPHYFCDIRFSEVERVQVSTVASNLQWEEQGTISFVWNDVRWCRWSAFMNGLLADLSMDGKNPMSPDTFRILIGDEYPNDMRLHDWLKGSDWGYEKCQEWFTNLRACLDAMKEHWVGRHRIVTGKWTHATPSQFVRGALSGTTTPVIELLKTSEGAKQVMDYILAESDLSKEEPEEAVSDVPF